MLTSSEAKFRCMWHMVVWSVMLMVVSQFFRLTDHIAFYIFASAAMLLLPLITSIYSNTAGRHGAGLLRVSYIFCDPVLACITVIPILLINRLPFLVQQFACLDQPPGVINDTACSPNTSLIVLTATRRLSPLNDLTRPAQLVKVRMQIGLIQASLVAPSLLTLAMGRRTRKMSYATIVGVACYWLIVCVETADLVDVKLISLAIAQHHAIISAASVVAIAAILTNSYAVVTLCSYICPTDQSSQRFDTLYRFLVGTSGFVFAEVPLLVTRGQVIGAGGTSPLPTIFYIWVVKDIVFICVAMITVGVYVFGARQGVMSASCGRLAFDNPDVFFAPEKRDAYIVRHKSLLRPNINRVVVGAVDSDSDSDIHEARKSPNAGNGGAKKKKKVTFRLDAFSPHHSIAPSEAVAVGGLDEEKLQEMRDSCV